MQEEFLSQQDLAIRWALHVQTLTKWRTLRRGPPFVKLGKIVRYAMSDILEFERNGLANLFLVDSHCRMSRALTALSDC